jgi:IMP dehydrogenase
MTAEHLVTAPVGTSLDEAKAILHRHRIEKLPLVDDQFILRGLITYKDILKKRDFPNQATDARGRLLVAAAVGVGHELDERLERLLDVGVDAVAVDRPTVIRPACWNPPDQDGCSICRSWR